MAQASSKLFDNVGRLMNDAAGVADGVRREIESMVTCAGRAVHHGYESRQARGLRRAARAGAAAERRAQRAQGRSRRAQGRRQPRPSREGRRHLGRAWQPPRARGGARRHRAAEGRRDAQPRRPRQRAARAPLDRRHPASISISRRSAAITSAIWSRSRRRSSAVDRFAQEQMDTRHRIWINALPATLALLDDVFMCHGTPTSCDEPWLDNWWNGRTVTTPDEAQVAAQGRGLRLPGDALRAYACAARGAAQGRAADRQSGQRGAAVQPRLAGCPLCDDRACATASTIRAFMRCRTTTRRRRGRRRPTDFRHWRDALTTGWAGAGGLF